jgi:transcriptional regulator with XRE-family HTH domain
MTSPADIRTIFGENLKLLIADYPSVTYLAHELGVNRTQLNRYLSGDSFPRPDVLARICKFFGVDARILLEPLNDIKNLRPRHLD